MVLRLRELIDQCCDGQLALGLVLECERSFQVLALGHSPYVASSTKRQSAFARRICGIVLQFTSSRRGLATRYARQRAREIATLSRLRDSRNSSPRGTSSPLELAIE